jgi:polar amino acid transport system substrate-binding protein
MSTPAGAKKDQEIPAASHRKSARLSARSDTKATAASPADVPLPLADVLDAKLMQSLLDDFYAVAHIPMAIIDMQGEVLAGVAWQHVCTDFHRVHPETCKNCIESDTKLTAGIAPGQFKLYKCKNNMWDIATPLMVEDQQVGNIFSGQFVFDDEPFDTELFREQARRYGFDERQYLAALAEVPVLSRSHLETCMTFLTKLAHMISQMSYSNIRLARSLAEQRQSQEALVRSEKLASVGRTAAVIAHEINNPLAAALALVYMARNDEAVPRRAKERLALAEHELNRAGQITHSTLMYYRESPNPVPTNPVELVQSVLTFQRGNIRKAEIQLQTVFSNSEPIYAFPGELRQVFTNLISNAIDALPPQGKLVVRVHPARDHASMRDGYRIVVADNGPGIAEESRPKLFEPFYTTKGEKGTGLGLWVTKQLVGKHGGIIAFRSRCGPTNCQSGTVFSVWLPRAHDFARSVALRDVV